MAGKKRKKKVPVIKTFKFASHFAGGDLVTIQIAARLKKVPKGLKVTKALLADMVRRKAATSSGFWDGRTVVGAKEGIDPRGIELRITRWKNPDRKRRGLRGWRTSPPATQAEAWGSLRHPIAAAAIAYR